MFSSFKYMDPMCPIRLIIQLGSTRERELAEPCSNSGEIECPTNYKESLGVFDYPRGNGDTDYKQDFGTWALDLWIMSSGDYQSWSKILTIESLPSEIKRPIQFWVDGEIIFSGNKKKKEKRLMMMRF